LAATVSIEIETGARLTLRPLPTDPATHAIWGAFSRGQNSAVTRTWARRIAWMGFCLVAIALLVIFSGLTLAPVVWLGLVVGLFALVSVRTHSRPSVTVASTVLGVILLVEIVPVSWIVGLGGLKLMCPEGAGFFGGPQCRVAGGFWITLGAQGLAQIVQLSVAVGLVVRKRIALRAAILVELLLMVGTATMLVPSPVPTGVALVLVVLFLGVVMGNSALRDAFTGELRAWWATIRVEQILRSTGSGPRRLLMCLALVTFFVLLVYVSSNIAHPYR
jgi:hypothetical protein